jgi:hypothetical protein
MSWIRSSKGVLLAVLLAGSLVAAGTATAYSVSVDAPDDAEVGNEVTLTATIDEPFPDDDSSQEWTLRGTTGLDQANWSVRTSNVGNPDGLAVGSGSEVTTQLSAANGTTEVVVEVTGVAPTIDTYSYENQANVTGLVVQKRVDGSVQDSTTASLKLYTADSREARNAIQEAEAALGDGASTEAENMLSNAKAFYDSGQFEKAIQNANDAKSASEGGLPIIPIVGGIVVLVALVGGVVYYRRSQRGTGHKLQ